MKFFIEFVIIICSVISAFFLVIGALAFVLSAHADESQASFTIIMTVPDIVTINANGTASVNNPTVTVTTDSGVVTVVAP